MAKAERIHNLMKQQDELFSRFLRTTDNTEANALYEAIQAINGEINALYA